MPFQRLLVAQSNWTPTHVVNSITTDGELLAFVYSPRERSLISWSDNLEKVLGVRDLSLVPEGNIFLRFVHDADRFMVLNSLEDALKGRQNYRVTYRWIRPDSGELRWLHSRGTLLRDSDEELFEGFILDLTDEIAPKSLEDSVLWNSTPFFFCTLDPDLRINRINTTWIDHGFNFEDPEFKSKEFVPGRHILSAFSKPELREELERKLKYVLNGDRATDTRLYQTNRSSQLLTILPMYSNSTNDGLICTLFDRSIEQRHDKELQALRQNEGARLIAAGVTHTLNNSLQTIMGEAMILKNHPNDAVLVRKTSEQILEAVSNAAQLTQRIGAAESANNHLVLPQDLNVAVITALNRTNGLFGSGAKVQLALGSISKVLSVERTLNEALEIVFSVIASSLLEEDTLNIKSYETEEVADDFTESEQIRYAKLALTLSRASHFEPLQESKLNQAFTLIREVGGAVSIEGRLNSGTLSIFLPIDERRNTSQNSNGTIFKKVTSPQVLVIDDDQMVLRTLSAMLCDLGFVAIEAHTFEEAIKAIQQYGKTLKIVLLDAIMPSMDGASMLKRIRRLNPGLKVVGFSGASESVTQTLLDAGALEIIRKPADPATIKKVLERYIG